MTVTACTETQEEGQDFNYWRLRSWQRVLHSCASTPLYRSTPSQDIYKLMHTLSVTSFSRAKLKD